jgi:hypothetical protein
MDVNNLPKQLINVIIKGFKNNKAPDSDKLINEFLKNSPPFLVSIYTKLFNVVLDTGIIPETNITLKHFPLILLN